MRKRRRGRLFRQNQETISVGYDNARYDPYEPEGPMNEKMIDVATGIVGVFHPYSGIEGRGGGLENEFTVPVSKGQFIIVLEIPNDAIKDTHRVMRSDGTEYQIQDQLEFGGAHQLLVQEQGIQ